MNFVQGSASCAKNFLRFCFFGCCPPHGNIFPYISNMEQAHPAASYFYIRNGTKKEELTMSLFAEMMKNPKVIGVKNSSMPTQDIQMFKAAGKAAKGDFVVFNGPDEQFAAGRAIGADGGIGGTYGVMPELFLKLNELIAAGEREKAAALQYDINEIIYKMCSSHANMYAVAKEMLRINAGLDIGGVREPLENLQEADKAIAKAAAEMVCAAKAKYL